MLTSRELEVIAQFAECIYVSQEYGENYRLQCNWCSGHEFGDTDLEAALPEILEHIAERHPSKLAPSVKPVTDEEVAEVFGVPLPPR